MKVSVVVPVYNEIATIDEILSRIRAVELPGLTREIIVVDDFSSDGTRERLAEIADTMEGVKLIYHDQNRGKGAALRTGFEATTGDIVIVQDADLEYDPAEYPILLGPILDGRADVVFGSRFLGGPHRVLFFWHYVGNKVVTLLSNALSNLNLTDMMTCYKVFRREVLEAVALSSDRFGFEPEFTVKVAMAGFRIYEVPISYSGRSYAEGKKITWKDTFSVVGASVRARFLDSRRHRS